MVSKGNEEAVRILVEHGADVNYKADGGTILFGTIFEITPWVVKLLLEYGARVDIRLGDIEKTYLSQMHLTALYGRIEMIEILLDNGTLIDDDGTSLKAPPIFAAMESGSWKTFQLLVSRGDDLFKTTCTGENLLGASMAQWRILRYLLAKGFDPNKGGTEG